MYTLAMLAKDKLFTSKKLLIPLLVFLLIASAYVTISPTLQNLHLLAQEKISVKGTISIYGCEKPQKVELVLCNDAACSQPLQIDSLGTVSTQTIKHMDANTDNTWIYQYAASELNFNSSASPYIQSVTAYFANGTHITNKPERNGAMIIAGEMSRDFFIDASEKCACDIQATAYIKDEKGAFITEFDGKEGFGLSNGFSFAKNGDVPSVKFKDGKVTVGPGTYRSLYSDNIYGKNAFASVKLYAPGWTVLRQECQSNGLTNGCPVLASDFTMDADKLAYPKVLEKLSIGCGVDVQYGWVLKKETQPLPEKNATQEIEDRHAKLLLEREGFGKDVTGGAGGTHVVVTRADDNLADPQEGSLRWAAKLPFPAIITFAIDKPIVLQEDIYITSNKTIDGRGSNVILTGRGGLLVGNNRPGNPIGGVENVIITDVTIRDMERKDKNKCYGFGDAISIIMSRKVWIHHVALSNYCDGLIDMAIGSKEITVSWSRLENHNKAMLISSSENDEELDRNTTVTLHHNYFLNNVQRQPRVRFAKVDMYNNYIKDWEFYATAYSYKSQVIMENNIYDAKKKLEAARSRIGADTGPGIGRAVGNLLIDNATIQSRVPELVFTRPYPANISPADETLLRAVENQSGPRL